MIPKEWREYTWTVRPLVVLTWLLVSPAVVFPLLWIWSSDGIDWPAWVQAVGSVVAILVAVWVSHREVRLQADGRLLVDYSYMHRALSVAGYGAQAVITAADELLTGGYTHSSLDFQERLLEVAIQDLEEIKYASIDSMEVATNFLSIKRAACHTKASVVLVRQTGNNFTVPQLNAWKANVSSNLQCMSDALSAYVEANPRLADLAQ